MTDEPRAVILLCYDGSADAEAAADRAATLFPDARIVVLTVWQPYVEMIAQDGIGLAYAPPPSDAEKTDAVIEQQARTTAEEGVARLALAGTTAEARAEMRITSVAATIMAVADELHADAIVLGTRGRGGFKSLVLGSVSHAVVQRAARPVLVIPSPAVAGARGDLRG